MDEQATVSVIRAISSARFQRYRQLCASDAEALDLYLWNIRLSEALFPILSLFEVTLRNATHDALAHRHGSAFWFGNVLHPRAYANVSELTHSLTRRYGEAPTADKVVSEISFGFWVRLFAKQFNALWWDNPHRPLLMAVLPHHPGIARDTRSQFERRLEYFLRLRNRAMHQEAIFGGVAALNRPVITLDVLHREFLETLGWINQDVQALVRSVDRFERVFAARPTP